MLRGMEGTQIGVWVAHGEGRVEIDNTNLLNNSQYSCFPIKYVDYQGNSTNAYPHNPNGSPDGITAICSENGRHLAMMPHPERCFLNWQMPWIPEEYKDKIKKYTPWYMMFKNAYNWCIDIN